MITVFLPIADMIQSFRMSDSMGKGIVIILLAGSVIAWSLMVTKWTQLRRAQREARRFLQRYHTEQHPLALYLKRQKSFTTPVAIIYEKTCDALGDAMSASTPKEQDLFMGGVGEESKTITEKELSGIQNVSERTMADTALALEDHMGVIATAVAVAPLLGLLGTVWGVMNAFSEMSVVGTAMLAAVAPGISSALLTTVVGLLVALPSTIGYNALSHMIRKLCVEMENFVQELAADIEREYVKRT